MSDAPNPDDLRFDYVPFEKPLRWTSRVTDGSHVEFVKRGRMRALWNSPSGPFYLAWASEDDMTEQYRAEPQLRQRVAASLAEAYGRALHAPSAGGDSTP